MSRGHRRRRGAGRWDQTGHAFNEDALAKALREMEAEAQMTELVVEVADGGGWRRMGQLHPGDPPGSLSHNTPEGREVITFTCHGDYSVIERSLGGVDVEQGEARTIHTSGTEELARLASGEKIDLWLRPDTMPQATRFRFRHA